MYQQGVKATSQVRPFRTAIKGTYVVCYGLLLAYNEGIGRKQAFLDDFAKTQVIKTQYFSKLNENIPKNS